MKLYKLLSLSVIFFIASCSNAQTETDTSFVKNIDATEFKELSKEKTIIDVRTPEEVVQGKIETALPINLYDADFKEQIEKLNLNKSEEVYVYCRSGGRSASAAEILNEMGFTKIYNLSGGIMGWIAKEYPTVK
jgi:rhodanese-related sulfurtransferase